MSIRVSIRGISTFTVTIYLAGLATEYGLAGKNVDPDGHLAPRSALASSTGSGVFSGVSLFSIDFFSPVLPSVSSVTDEDLTAVADIDKVSTKFRMPSKRG